MKAEEGVKLKLVEFPPLGAVEVVADGKPEPIAPVIAVGPSPTPPTGGSGGNGANGRSIEAFARREMMKGNRQWH